MEVESKQAIGQLELHSGIMMPYCFKRISHDQTKLICYTGKGIGEICMPINKKDILKAEELKQLSENRLIEMGYLDVIPFTKIKEVIG